jgi:uncharacterized protein YecE (DUF72 family)
MADPLNPHRTLVGTSGWQYPHWRELYYPADLPAGKWLPHYAAEFPCVEVNSSLFGLPDQSDIEQWCQLTSPGFRFAVKAPRAITHFKKLKNCELELQTLLTRLNVFGERLGPLLFQLPERWRCNTRRLADMLRELPDGRRYAFEFRDPSWHCDEIYALLREHNAALCLHDLGGSESPTVPTADFVYVRLHGPVMPQAGTYRAHVLRGWTGRAMTWNRQGKDVYMFFDNDQRGYAVKNARRVQGILGEGAAHPGEPLRAASR